MADPGQASGAATVVAAGWRGRLHVAAAFEKKALSPSSLGRARPPNRAPRATPPPGNSCSSLGRFRRRCGYSCAGPLRWRQPSSWMAAAPPTMQPHGGAMYLGNGFAHLALPPRLLQFRVARRGPQFQALHGRRRRSLTQERALHCVGGVVARASPFQPPSPSRPRPPLPPPPWGSEIPCHYRVGEQRPPSSGSASVAPSTSACGYAAKLSGRVLRGRQSRSAVVGPCTDGCVRSVQQRPHRRSSGPSRNGL